MKRHHFNFLSFLFVVGLMVAAVLATYVATTGTGGFMTRADDPNDCTVKTSKVSCERTQRKNCYWTKSTDSLERRAGIGKCNSKSDKYGPCRVNAQCLSPYTCKGAVCLGMRIDTDEPAKINTDNAVVEPETSTVNTQPNKASSGGKACPTSYCENGTLCGGTAVRGIAGQTVCGLGSKQYKCGKNGNWVLGSKTPCSCAACPGGVLSDGTPITGYSGQVVCGLNNIQYICGVNGAWEWSAPSCSCGAN